MEKIIIKPEAAYYGFYEEETDKWTERDLIGSSLPISWYTNLPVQIVGKVSIRRIFELFERYEDQLTFMYSKALKTLTFRQVLTILESGEAEEDLPIKSVCLVWAGELIEEDEETCITINNALVGLDTEDDSEDTEEDGIYQLTNFDFIEWASVPIYIDNVLDFVKDRGENVMFGGVYHCKFGDFLECILSEISLNLFVSGQVSNPEVVVTQRSNPMNIIELFKYLDELENRSTDF